MGYLRSYEKIKLLVLENFANQPYLLFNIVPLGRHTQIDVLTIPENNAESFKLVTTELGFEF